MYHAGATRDGLNLQTSIYMWQMLYLPIFTHALQIWFDQSMAEALDTAILEPLLKVLPVHTQHTLNPHHQRLIATELNLFISHQLHAQSLLSYTARLPTKPLHSPARRLYETLRHINHPSHQTITRL